MQHYKMPLFSLLLFAKPLPAFQPSAGCGRPMPEFPQPGMSTNFGFIIEDPGMGPVVRGYRLHVPLNYPTDNVFPLSLVVDYHGFTGDPVWQEDDSHFAEVADEDPEGFLVVYAQGMDDNEEGWRSFNCSRTDGPLGAPCDTDRAYWGEISCYNSCTQCDPLNSCDWSSCYDDVFYTKALIDEVSGMYCVDLDSIHQSGVSNGGMFSWYIASRLDIFATIAPVAATPLLGFGDAPESSQHFSVIDFHGTSDDTIPYTMETSEGPGPHNTIISWDGYYYYEKPDFIRSYSEELGCGPEEIWPTHMDGVYSFQCIIHRGCQGGGEVVHCKGDHGHDYPFGPKLYIEGARILWNFMKTHPKKSTELVDGI